MIIRQVYRWTYFIFLLVSLLLLYGIYTEKVTYIGTDVSTPLMATGIAIGIVLGTLLHLIIHKTNTTFRKIMAVIFSLAYVFLSTYYLMGDKLRLLL